MVGQPPNKGPEGATCTPFSHCMERPQCLTIAMGAQEDRTWMVPVGFTLSVTPSKEEVQVIHPRWRHIEFSPCSPGLRVVAKPRSTCERELEIAVNVENGHRRDFLGGRV